MNEELVQLQKTYQKAFETSIESIDKDFLRKMQADQYRCSVKCCENLGYSGTEVQNCLTSCSQPIVNAQSFIENEINSFQNRLQRCMLDCADSQKDKLPSKPSDRELKVAEAEVNRCAKSCVDSHIDNHLPSLMQRIRSKLKENL